MQDSLDVASRATLHMVARLHYQSDMTQVEIARKLGLSTATVSRLLQKARALGIVKIEVMDPTHPDEVAAALHQALKLKRVGVVDMPSTASLAVLAAPLSDMLVQERLKSDCVIGIGWGRAVREVIEVGLPRIAGTHAVALNGGMKQSAPHFQTNEFVRQAAEQLGGTAHFLHAPYFSSIELREAFFSDPFIQETTGLWDRLDCAIVGIGPQPKSKLIIAGIVTENEKAIHNAAGDVIRHYVDISGNILPWQGQERMIAASVEQLRRAGLSIGVAAGTEKVTGIIGAVRSAMINALVTDTSTALAILDMLQQVPEAKEEDI